MPSVLYSAKCYIKNSIYCLSIANGDEDASEFTSTTLSLSSIKPAITKINIDLINDKKRSKYSKTISINALLSIEQVEEESTRNRKDFGTINESFDGAESIADPSRQNSIRTFERNRSDTGKSVNIRQFSFSRIFSSQTHFDTETDFLQKTVIIIKYIDVSDSIRWNIKRLKLHVETQDIANELYMNLNMCLSVLEQRPRSLLAFVNPFGGKGRASLIYQRKVLPIFNEAKISVKSIYTERANHARDYVLKEDLSEYDGLVCVGGDGMFAELCHGLLLRTSREAQLNIDDPQVKIIRPNLRIGIIPAGSTDAVVFGTTGLSDPITSALQIIVGETLSIDIATVHNEKGFVRFMATMLAYGFFGDIIHQSDKWRCLGPLRYDLAGFCHFIRNRAYHTEVTITLLPPESSHKRATESISLINSDNNTDRGITGSSVSPNSHQLLNNVHQIQTETYENIIKPGLIFCSRNCELCSVIHSQQSNETQLPLKIKCEGRYTTINCLNMPCRCAKSKFGMSPFVHLGDGTADLLLVKRSWRTGFLRFLWQVANDGRSIEDLPNVERYRASEVLIRPLHTDRRRIGNWAIDGELVSGNEIKIRVHRQVLNLFASGIQFDKLIEYNRIENMPTKTDSKTFFNFRKKPSRNT